MNIVILGKDKRFVNELRELIEAQINCLSVRVFFENSDFLNEAQLIAKWKTGLKNNSTRVGSKNGNKQGSINYFERFDSKCIKAFDTIDSGRSKEI